MQYAENIAGLLQCKVNGNLLRYIMILYLVVHRTRSDSFDSIAHNKGWNMFYYPAIAVMLGNIILYQYNVGHHQAAAENFAYYFCIAATHVMLLEG